MGLFKSSTPKPQQPVVPETTEPGTGPQRKSAPTPTRRAAEAARRERLNPTLSPKEAKARERAARMAQRERSFQAMESSAERQLMRDVVDSRFNAGEFAMPILLAVLATTFLPNATAWVTWALYFTWGYFALILADTWFMWRKFKRLAAQRGVPTKGMGFYGFNRTLSFRRWRQPAPRIKRGEQVP